MEYKDSKRIEGMPGFHEVEDLTEVPLPHTRSNAKRRELLTFLRSDMECVCKTFSSIAESKSQGSCYRGVVKREKLPIRIVQQGLDMYLVKAKKEEGDEEA